MVLSTYTKVSAGQGDTAVAVLRLCLLEQPRQCVECAPDPRRSRGRCGCTELLHSSSSSWVTRGNVNSVEELCCRPSGMPKL